MSHKNAKGVLPWKDGDELPEDAVKRSREERRPEIDWVESILGSTPAESTEVLRRLIEDNERLRGLVAQAECVGGDGFCPWCDVRINHPHEPNCPAFSAPGVVR